MLMRAPEESGSWTWDLDEVAAPGLESLHVIAGRMSAVLLAHDLLAPASLEWDWSLAGKGILNVTSRLNIGARPLGDPALPDRLHACRPTGNPQADIGGVLVLGSGAWIDANGARHEEYRLVELLLTSNELGIWDELSVFHDVWAECDFRGVPQPLIHANNAPRLAAALQELEQVLGVAAEPGEPTYYGRAEGYGLGAPDLIDGLGPDVTDAALG
ncbi:hypothetical protein [Streptomyces sp. A0592]|uniref:hypothetical protein n=1 Tax=Streptomyces sp. A0592 TaxID=2563099 RepID=UPI00109E86E1|nr:hypothetical protein [Streptomyces sp. A0592]THA82451.1 hypothetical protein E6U81_20360 [Streptomyces sp. A0592]